MNRLLAPKTMVVITCVAILLIAVIVRQSKSSPESPVSSKVTTISTIQPSIATLEVIEPTIGRIKCRRSPIVTAEVPGKILSVHVEKGQTVQPGQLLLTLDDHDFQLEKENAQAEIHRLQALIQHSQQQVVRFEKMVKENYVSQARLEAHQTELLAYQAQLESAQSKLKLTNHKISKSKVFSPITGVVEERFISLGDFVGIGHKTFKIAATDALLIELPFPRSYSTRIKPGMKVLLCPTVNCSNPIQTTITYTLPSIQSDSHNMYAIIESNNDELKTPGGTIHAKLVLETRKQALMIPKLSVVNRPQGTVVYTVINEKAIEKPVELGILQNELIEVKTGIHEHDILALDGAEFLSNNADVYIANKKT